MLFPLIVKDPSTKTKVIYWIQTNVINTAWPQMSYKQTFVVNIICKSNGCIYISFTLVNPITNTTQKQTGRLSACRVNDLLQQKKKKQEVLRQELQINHQDLYEHSIFAVILSFQSTGGAIMTDMLRLIYSATL